MMSRRRRVGPLPQHRADEALDSPMSSLHRRGLLGPGLKEVGRGRWRGDASALVVPPSGSCLRRPCGRGRHALAGGLRPGRSRFGIGQRSAGRLIVHRIPQRRRRHRTRRHLRRDRDPQPTRRSLEQVERVGVRIAHGEEFVRRGEGQVQRVERHVGDDPADRGDDVGAVAPGSRG